MPEKLEELIKELPGEKQYEFRKEYYSHIEKAKNETAGKHFSYMLFALIPVVIMLIVDNSFSDSWVSFLELAFDFAETYLGLGIVFLFAFSAAEHFKVFESRGKAIFSVLLCVVISFAISGSLYRMM